MTQYRANAPRFVDETVDGEALIMDMVSGTYYSCVGASTVVWNALKQGVPDEAVVDGIAAMYGISVERARTDIDAFVAQLIEEHALVPGEGRGATFTAPEDVTGEYAPPQLERYTDLADLILLDPVHDVTDAGWPTEQG